MSLRRLIANVFLKGLGFRHLSGTGVQRLVRAVLDEIDLQHFRDTNPCRCFSDRSEMYRYVNESVVRGEAIDYLEFGVHRGDSIREWIKNNQHPDSRFYGFDSFEGLPEKWREKQEAGHFDVQGEMPKIEDSRLTFIKGWFHETVPPFVRAFSAKSKLVLHLDADLYGSTILPMVYLAPVMAAGSLLIFDEFYDRQHEFKALQDFLRIFRIRYRAVCEMENFGRVCLEVQ